MSHPRDAQSRLWRRRVDPCIGVKRTEGSTWRAGLRVQEESRTHLEHDREPADFGRNGIHIATAITPGGLKQHVDSMICMFRRFRSDPCDSTLYLHISAGEIWCKLVLLNRDEYPHAKNDRGQADLPCFSAARLPEDP